MPPRPNPITRPPVCVCAKLRCHKTNHTEHPHDSTKTACFRNFLLHFRPPKSERSMILGTTEKAPYGAKENTLDIRKPNIQKNDPIQWPLQALDGLVLDPALPRNILQLPSASFFRLTRGCWSKNDQSTQEAVQHSYARPCQAVRLQPSTAMQYNSKWQRGGLQPFPLECALCNHHVACT